MQKGFKATICNIGIAMVAWLFMAICYAGSPPWTFTPDPNYLTSFSITSAGSATIKYTVTNQSHKTHSLVMKPITGVSQVVSEGNCPSLFTLAYHQSCILNLLVNGNVLTSNVVGGPIVCEQGSLLECYQPSLDNALNIMLMPLAKYLITPVVGSNGTIAPSTPQIVIAGSSLTFTATPNTGFQVDQWLVDGQLAQKGGTTFALTSIDTNHLVEATFTQAGILYSATASGYVYFSTDNGLTWTPTTIPSPGNAVNSIFATSSALYVGSADGRVYYSTNNGVSWNVTQAVPNAVAVNSVFVTRNNNVVTIYSGTQDGIVYYSTDSVTWTATPTSPGAGAVNGLFISSLNTMYVGSGDGNVYYSINNGNSWNQIAGPEASIPVPIQNIFATSNQLYVNTRKVTSNTTLPPGTIDFEYTYSTDSLINANPTWSLFSQITYTLFVNDDASVIYAGTQNGYVFSLITGDELGFITYSPITSLFFLS